ncbi:CLUMA_CG002944, isoform A [Clunio marinus]|uniref:CLUMA_CG002944, isoform A n=1 Tax=Clunio marinus TaxID=568069 RepID=A0A1J1HMA0_9DIPT|nr:CLUMA_CG002944, isoform A [Clunio marinus]
MEVTLCLERIRDGEKRQTSFVGKPQLEAGKLWLFTSPSRPLILMNCCSYKFYTNLETFVETFSHEGMSETGAVKYLDGVMENCKRKGSFHFHFPCHCSLQPHDFWSLIAHINIAEVQIIIKQTCSLQRHLNKGKNMKVPSAML